MSGTSGTTYQTPTLTDLIALAQADITDSTLPGADGLLPVSNLVIMAMVQARLAYDHYGYLANIALNSVPFTATGQFTDAWAALKNVYRKDATAAGGTNAASWTGTPTTVLPDATPFTRSDGFSFETVGAGTIAGNGTVIASVVALEVGSAGNTSVGALVSL